MSEATEKLERHIAQYQKARMEVADRLAAMVGQRYEGTISHLMTLSREMGELQAKLDALKHWGL